MTNHSFFGKLSWPQIVERSAKIVNFYDLGGSEKALKSSIKSLSPNYLDYLALVVSASSGITNDTIIFLKLALAMNLPVMIIVTKIDLLLEEDKNIFLNNLNYIIKLQMSKKNPLVTKNQEDVVMFSRLMKESIIPIFLVSNKSGKGLDLFINFLNVLPSNNSSLVDYNSKSNIQFDIHSILTLEKDDTKEKIILVGILSQGSIEKNTQLMLGPNEKGEFKLITIKAIHCKKIEVNKVFKGQYCTIEVDAKENDVRKGMVLIDQQTKPSACRVFEAKIWNIGDKEIKIIGNKTQLAVSSGHIRQIAVVKSDVEEIIIKPEEEKFLTFEFMFNPVYIQEGCHLLIMENFCKCYGVVQNVLN